MNLLISMIQAITTAVIGAFKGQQQPAQPQAEQPPLTVAEDTQQAEDALHKLAGK